MKKIMFAVLLAVLALGMFSGVAGAQTIQPPTGPLHQYMEQALAEKLNVPLATIEAQFDAGKTLYQIALDNGVTQANLATFMVEVRTTAIKAALADGVITQAQADKMLRVAGRGMGRGTGMMLGSAGSGPCGGTGVPVGSGMHRGGNWQQVNP
jgi:hypothetical protein